ncbi:hypothetical protein AAY473_017654, partial [Plecturocebus cupreus]
MNGSFLRPSQEAKQMSALHFLYGQQNDEPLKPLLFIITQPQSLALSPMLEYNGTISLTATSVSQKGSLSVTQAGVQWKHHGSLQPLLPELNLLSSWDCRVTTVTGQFLYFLERWGLARFLRLVLNSSDTPTSDSPAGITGTQLTGFLVEMRFYHVCRAGLKLLTSGDPQPPKVLTLLVQVILLPPEWLGLQAHTIMPETGFHRVDQAGLKLLASSDLPAVASQRLQTGFHHVGQADLELLTSTDPPTWVSQSAKITSKRFQNFRSTHKKKGTVFKRVLLCCPDWSAVALSQLTANSTSRAQ